jgi:two-component system, chemotaxis family, sensor kinase Cph1
MSNLANIHSLDICTANLKGEFYESCEREPLNYINSVQAVGSFLAFKHSNHEVVALSQDLLSKIDDKKNVYHLKDVTTPLLYDSIYIELKSFHSRYNQDFTNEHLKSIFISSGFIPEDKMYFSLYLTLNDLILVELEQSLGEHPSLTVREDSLPNVGDLPLNQYLEQTLTYLNNFLNFDRLLIYRFDNDLSGEVVAERKYKDSLPSYFGLRFPASDIPQMARRLYKENKIRFIYDVDAPDREIVYLRPEFDPLDLSAIGIRSISPIHIQYLRNMDVKASLSLSIVIQNKLWGLIVGHNTKSKLVDFSKRAVSTFLAEVVSSRIAKIEERENLNEERRRNKLLLEIMRSVVSNQDLNILTDKACNEILALVQADGFAIYSEGGYRSVGEVSVSERAIDFLVKHCLNDRTNFIFTSDQVRQDFPLIKDELKEVAGVALVKLGHSVDDVLIWFRKEIVKEVKWAGAKNDLIADGDRLLPRKSFSIWKEIVRDRSRPWDLRDVETLNNFRSALLDIWVDRFKEFNDLLKAKNERLVFLRNELQNLVQALGHDLKTPLTSVVNLINILQLQFGGDGNLVDILDRIKRCSAKSLELVDDLVHVGRIGELTINKTYFSPFSIIQQISDLILPRYSDPINNEPKFSLQFKGADAAIFFDLRRFEQVITNLIVNSIRHSKINEGLTIIFEIVQNVEFIFLNCYDNGLGINREFLPRAFDIFEKFDRNSSGNGVGLSIVKKIMQLHNGEAFICNASDLVGSSELSKTNREKLGTVVSLHIRK